MNDEYQHWLQPVALNGYINSKSDPMLVGIVHWRPALVISVGGLLVSRPNMPKKAPRTLLSIFLALSIMAVQNHWLPNPSLTCSSMLSSSRMVLGSLWPESMEAFLFVLDLVWAVCKINHVSSWERRNWKPTWWMHRLTKRHTAQWLTSLWVTCLPLHPTASTSTHVAA